MNAFETFFATKSDQSPEALALAQAAWDSALCAVQAQNFDPNGKMRSAQEITATISRLHSWNATRATR